VQRTRLEETQQPAHIASTQQILRVPADELPAHLSMTQQVLEPAARELPAHLGTTQHMLHTAALEQPAHISTIQTSAAMQPGTQPAHIGTTQTGRHPLDRTAVLLGRQTLLMNEASHQATSHQATTHLNVQTLDANQFHFQEDKQEVAQMRPKTLRHGDSSDMEDKCDSSQQPAHRGAPHKESNTTVDSKKKHRRSTHASKYPPELDVYGTLTNAASSKVIPARYSGIRPNEDFLKPRNFF